ncbi:MAG TPA: hypothetical protein DIV86_01445 [Alphaproteobacteria bacterium]|nr:hypothetical protein [Alphaproteobacteria bacterium]
MLALLVLASCDGKENLPSGFELVSSDGISHFMYVDKVQYGDRVAQREAGRIVCTVYFQQEDYCDVYLWKSRDNIPNSLPIINRSEVIGVYRMRNGSAELKPLMEDNSAL